MPSKVTCTSLLAGSRCHAFQASLPFAARSRKKAWSYFLDGSSAGGSSPGVVSPLSAMRDVPRVLRLKRASGQVRPSGNAARSGSELDPRDGTNGLWHTPCTAARARVWVAAPIIPGTVDLRKGAPVNPWRSGRRPRTVGYFGASGEGRGEVGLIGMAG